MQTYKATRYRCDFCTKSMTNKRSMGFHERGCMLNPNRVCTFCEFNSLSHTQPEHLDNVLYCTGDDREVLRAAGGCPLCTLAAIMRHNIELDKFERYHFDYKGALEKFDEAREKEIKEKGEVAF